MSDEQAAGDHTFAQWKKTQALSVEEKLSRFTAALEALGITKVTFSYEGEGDEGECYNPEFFYANETENSEDVPDQLERDLLEWIYDVLNETYMGWMDGNGGRGDIVLDVLKQQVIISHEYRVYTFETEPPLVAVSLAPPPQGE